MKFTIAILFIFFYLTACKSENDKLLEKITPVVREVVLKDSLIRMIDSLVIYDIDTLTELSDSTYKVDAIFDEIKSIQLERTYELEMGELTQSSMELSKNQISLYRMIGSETLAQAELTTLKGYIKESEDKIKAVAKLGEDVDRLLARVRNIQTAAADKKLDSLKLTGYVANFRVRGADKDNIQVFRDSLFILISPAFRLIKFNDYNRK